MPPDQVIGDGNRRKKQKNRQQIADEGTPDVKLIQPANRNPQQPVQGEVKAPHPHQALKKGEHQQQGQQHRRRGHVFRYLLQRDPLRPGQADPGHEKKGTDDLIQSVGPRK